jgi:hypothetical protein
MAKMMVTLGDGTQVEVDVPEGYLTPEEISAKYMLKSTFESELHRRAGSIAKSQLSMVLPEDLLGDAEFVKKVAEKHGLVPKDSVTVTTDDEQVKQLVSERVTAAQEEWEREKLEPLADENVTLKGRVSGLLVRGLESEIVQAAAVAGVKDRYLKPSRVGGRPVIVDMLEGVFRHDDGHDRHFVSKDKENFVITANADSPLPYQTVPEFMAEWAGEKENSDFIDTAKQTGPDVGAPGIVTGKDVVLSPSEAADHRVYTTAQERADKQGGVVRVVDTT